MATLKFYRRKNRITQAEIAKILGIDQSSYSRKEKGDAQFTIAEAKKLSEILKMSIEDLFFKDIM